MSTLSDNMKKARHSLGWLQEKAAIEIGVKRSLLGAWEEGRSSPTLKTFPKVVSAYVIYDWQSFINNPNWNPTWRTPTDGPTREDVAKYSALKRTLKELAENC